MQGEASKNEGSGTWLSEKDVSPDFGPLRDERVRIDRIVDRLDVADDLVERADLASELVRSVSRYEDTLERALFVRLEVPASAVFEELNRERGQLREAMVIIHERTMGIDPRNVHASDGQGFEKTIEDVVHRLRALLIGEDRLMAELVRSLGQEDHRQLVDEVAHAFRSASEQPYPPRTAVGRFLSNAHVKLDHTFEDVATPSHPGADTING